MTREPYPQARLRPLRRLSWVVVSIGIVMVMFGIFFLVFSDQKAAVLAELLIPAILMTGLGSWSLSLLSENDARSRVAVPATASVTILVGVLLSGIGVGVLIGVVGVLLLMYALLPLRDPEPDAPKDG